MFIIFIVFLIIGGVVAFFVHKNHSGVPKSGCTQDGGRDGRPLCDNPDTSGDPLRPGQRLEGDNIVNSSGDVVGTQETNTITYDIVGVSNPGVFGSLPYLAGQPANFKKVFQGTTQEYLASWDLIELNKYMYVFFETPGTIDGKKLEDENDMAINLPSSSGSELKLSISSPDNRANNTVGILPSALRTGGVGSKDGGGSQMSNFFKSSGDVGTTNKSWPSSGDPTPNVRSISGSYTVKPETRFNLTDITDECSGNSSDGSPYIAAAGINTHIRIFYMTLQEGQSEVICQVGMLNNSSLSGNIGFKTGDTVIIQGINDGIYGGSVSSKFLTSNTGFVLTSDAGAGSGKGPYLRFDLGMAGLIPIVATATQTIKFDGGGGDQDVTARVTVGDPSVGDYGQMLKWNNCTAPFTGINRGCAETISAAAHQNYIKIPVPVSLDKSPFEILYGAGICAGSAFGIEKGALQIKIVRRKITPN